MVTVSNVSQKEGKDGKPYSVLELTGDVEIVFSKTTLRPYATARRTSIPATFSHEVCKTLIGKQIPGCIKKVTCESYEYTLPESGQVITLSHRWQFASETSETVEMEEAVFDSAQKKNTLIKGK